MSLSFCQSSALNKLKEKQQKFKMEKLKVLIFFSLNKQMQTIPVNWLTDLLTNHFNLSIDMCITHVAPDSQSALIMC